MRMVRISPRIVIILYLMHAIVTAIIIIILNSLFNDTALLSVSLLLLVKEHFKYCVLMIGTCHICT